MSAEQLVALDDRLLHGPVVPRPGEPARLAASRCPACGRHEFPVRTTCPACATEMFEVALGPDAVVDGFTSVSNSPPGGLVEVPYTVAAAAFPEGISILGVVVGETEGLRIGDPLHVIALQVGERIGFGFTRA